MSVTTGFLFFSCPSSSSDVYFLFTLLLVHFFCPSSSSFSSSWSSSSSEEVYFFLTLLLLLKSCYFGSEFHKEGVSFYNVRNENIVIIANAVTFNCEVTIWMWGDGVHNSCVAYDCFRICHCPCLTVGSVTLRLWIKQHLFGGVEVLRGEKQKLSIIEF